MNKYLTILYSTTLLVACSTTEDPILPSPNPGDGLVAIDFAPNLSDQETTTRATNHPLEQDFVVSGYKILKEEPKQLVFDKVTVSYNPDSTNNPYDYVNPDPDNLQPVRYWDKHATEYRFWAYSDTSTTHIDQTCKDDVVTLSVGDNSTPISQVEHFYYSGNVKVIPENYGETVKLTFKKLYTIVEIKFFTSINIMLDVPFEDIYLSDIVFAPAPPSKEKISVEGQIKIDYSLTGDPNVNITWPDEGTLTTLNFKNVTLKESDCGKDNAQTAEPKTETGTDPFVYTIYPTISDTTPFVLTLKVNGQDKEATVPYEFIGWKANHKYVYLFKVDEGLEPVLFDVKVEPWVKGGQQDLEFKNW